MLAGLILPHASGDEIAALSRHKRRAADGETAAAFLELELFGDARPFLPGVTMPTLVLHRRGDRAVPISRGRELASLLPHARFVALSGDSHLPHVDDQREVHRALAGFLDDAVAVERNGDSPLTGREAEVLRLVAAGLSNREIASSLVLSEHTVHRHVANILRKLTQSSRAAAAAQATRLGYI
jgi:DNA-binding CsgD family transcriptional regulator